MFQRKNVVEKIAFFANGEVHELEYEMRPLSRGEILAMSIEFPTVAGFLLGTSPFPYTFVREDNKVKRDFSQLENFFQFLQETVLVRLEIDGKPYEGSILDLPDMVVAMIFAKFRTFQFLTQGDVDFFEKINNSLNESLLKPNTSD